MESSIGNGSATGLGIHALRLFSIAQALEWEAKFGCRMVRTAPKMSTLVKRDYGFSVKRTPEGKREAAALFYALAERLRVAIQSGEKEHVSQLEATARVNGPAFLKILMEMLD